MKVKAYVSAVTCLALGLLCMGVAWAAPKGPPTLAVISDSSPEHASSAFADLLFLEMSKREDVALVERQDIQKLLKEQGLSLSVSEDASSALLVRCGKILSADTILLLKAEQHDKGGSHLRVRLLNTRHGFKLFDSLADVGTDSSVYSKRAQCLAGRVVAYVNKSNVRPDQLKMIGVSTFRSGELAPRWDWLGKAIANAVERRLALSPGVILMERRAVTSLMEERQLVATLPESLKAAAVLVSGSYRVDARTRRVAVKIQARQGARTLLDTHMEGPVDAVEELCAKMADAVSSGIGVNRESRPMDASIEAEMLADEARIYLKRQEPGMAIAPAESACALVPNSIEYRKLLLDALVRGQLRADTETRKYPPEAGRTFFRALNLAETIVRTQPLPTKTMPFDHLVHFKEIGNCLNDAGNYLHLYDRRLRQGEIYIASRDSFRRLTRQCRDAYVDRSACLHKRVLYYASQGLHFTEDVKEAIRIADWILADQRRLGVDPTVIKAYVNTAELHWRDKADALEKAGGYLASLRGSKDVEVRFRSLEESIRFYCYVLPDHRMAKKCAEEHVLLSKQLQKPKACAITYRRFSPDKKTSEAIEAKLLTEIFGFAYEKGLVNSSAQSWMNCTIRLADLLERAQRPEEAGVWLKRLIDQFGSSRSWKWERLKDRLAALQKKHPELSLVEPPKVASSRSPKLLLDFADKQLNNVDLSEGRFRRLLSKDDTLIIVYSRGETYGVIRLDARHGKVLSVQSSTERFDLKTRKNWLLRELNLGPTATLHKGNVYVGFTHAGILVFRRDGSTARMNEASGLAYNRIRHLECLGDKLYGIVGAVTEDSGLMEVDLKTGNSRILVSTKSEDSNHELNGKLIAGIAADPARGVLWVLSTFDSQPKGIFRRRLSRYDPKNASFETVNEKSLDRFLKSTHSIDTAKGLRRYGDALLVWQGYGLYLHDLTTGRGKTLLGTHIRSQWDFPRDFNSWHNVPVEGGMVSTVFGQLAEFKEGTKEPRLIANSSFPELGSSKLEVRDLIPTGQGLYVLTPRQLYLVPGIVARKGGEASKRP